MQKEKQDLINLCEHIFYIWPLLQKISFNLICNYDQYTIFAVYYQLNF